MNIISNCCAGGEFYKRVYKTQYMNPFIWSMMTADDFITLLKNYGKINYKKYKIKPVKDEDYFALEIDGKFDIVYTHYHYKDVEKTVHNVDVYYRDIKKYIVEKYLDRTNRMLSSNEAPEFFIISYTKYLYNYTYDKMLEIIDLINKLGFKCTIITQYYSLLEKSNDKIKIIHDPNVAKESENFPLFLIRDNARKLGLAKLSF